MIFLIR